ncbi:MAG: sulfatase-like hydrolase/transferase [Acidobacteriota bacterium]|nr:MAG: sulfatase-like hydrolase/transferase [Acidobacteriota bacterium]
MLFSLGVLGCGQSTRPNLLFITVDTLRADRLGCAGYADIETPAIDRLAHEGVYFPGLYATAPITFPTHASLFTSKYPFSHGARMNGLHVLDDAHPTLAEILRQQGYETGAVIGSFVLHSMFGLDQGFSYYDSVEDYPKEKTDFFQLRINDRAASEVTRLAVEWFDRSRLEGGPPWFLWVHYFDPHNPYEPPEPFRSRYEGSAYDGEIAYTDSQIGVLLEHLEEKNAMDDTLVVFVADHGEALGEHGEPTHSFFLYEATVRVPLIFYGQGISTRGMRHEAPASQVDVAPTVLDLLGLDIPSEFQGKSLRPLWENGAAYAHDVYMEAYTPYYDYRWAPSEALVRGPWKYILAPRPELYRTGEDPEELDNRTARDSERALEMRSALLSLRRRYPKASETKAELTQDHLEKLQSLGYLTGGAATLEEPDALKMAKILPDVKDRVPVIELNLRASRAANAGNFDEGIRLCREILAIDPENLGVLARLAKLYKKTEKLREEIRLRRKIADIEPSHTWSYYHVLAAWEEQQGNEEARKEALRKAADSFAINERLTGTLLPEELNNRARFYRLLEDYERAEADYKLGIEKYPHAAFLPYGLGNLYRRLERLDEARAMYEEALRRDPRHRGAKVNLSNVLAEQGHYERAIALIEEIHREFDPTAQTYSNLGQCHINLGKVDEGIDYLLKALEINPDHAESILGLAEILFREGRRERGIVYCKKVLSQDPENKQALALMDKYAGTPPG